MLGLRLLIFLIFIQELLGHQPESLLPAAIKYALAGSFNDTTFADVLNVVIQSDAKENQVIFLDTIDNILSDNWKFVININVNNNFGQLTSDFSLWFIDSYVAFRRLLPWIQAYHKDSQLYYFIVLCSSNTEKSHLHEIQNIFTDFLDLMVANVNVIIESLNGEVLFYTFYPFQDLTSCRSAKPFLTYIFKNITSNARRNFFPPKADNLNLCPLRIRTNNEIILNVANFGIPKQLINYEMALLEFIMLEELSSRMNFTLEIYDYPSTLLESELLSFQTSGEKSLNNGKIDFVLSYSFNQPYSNTFFSKSVPYYLTWLIMVLRPLTNNLQTFPWILEPFTVTTWIYIIVSFSSIIGCLTFAGRSTRFSKILHHLQYRQPKALEILSVVIGSPVLYMPRNNFLRFCIMVLMLGMFILRSAHQGKLFDVFRGRIKLKIPRSIKELSENNYTIYSMRFYKSFINNVNQVEYQYFREIPINEPLQNNLFENNKRIALVLSFINIFTFYTTTQRKALVMEPIFQEQICVFFQQHSIIQPKINEIIMRLEDSGILHNLRKTFENLNNQGLTLDRRYQEPKPLGLGHFTNAFYMSATLCTISCSVFIVELLWNKMLLGSAHQGKLFDAFRGHILLNPPRSIRELFAENYTIYSHSYYRSIINEINEMEYLNLQKLQFLNGMDYNKLFEEGKLNAFVSSYAQFYPFYTASQRGNLKIAPIIRQQVCVFFQQHSVIQPKINGIIVRLEEAGILRYFRRDFENLQDSGRIASNKRGEEPKQLDLERFGFVFYFGIVLYGISCLVFVLELLWTEILLMLTKLSTNI
ncbi:uncharacterized protein LOC129950383 [Eupeodes corollae]|uniref:uncharacterized protein LOC129950383 n=1 Tax=Eupeodes corollae TaxID=290404 RepID=UPI0024931B37|nr:uncharacterized protein LOC129950383 [Eupeodes corollae]